MLTVDERLLQILRLHFDDSGGAPYWLDQRGALPFNPLTDIRSVDDLVNFGPMPLDELAKRPIEDFVPRSLWPRLREGITSETGGSTGPPKRTVFFPEEFAEAFVTPFVRAAELTGFPRELHWLFIGPGGPHIIGKAARACAAAMSSMDPFTVDFDPRWARKLPDGSMSRRRYLEHVLEQSEAVLATQRIGVLFSTPPILEALGSRAPSSTRAAIRGVHLGGLPSTPEFLERLRTEWFPQAGVLGGYGNSLAGVCPEVESRPGHPPEYFPYGSRLVLGVEPHPAGARARVRFHRLDASMFLPNVAERDEATLAQPPAAAIAAGFRLPGLSDPGPVAAEIEDAPRGLY